MKDEIISYETANLAKEKGFNIPTRNFYADESWNDDKLYACNEVGYPDFTNDMESDHGFGDIILTPTQSQLQRWLREVHDLDVSPYPHYTNKWRFTIQEFNFRHHRGHFGVCVTKDWSGINPTTYEQALELGLQDALKLIKK